MNDSDYVEAMRRLNDDPRNYHLLVSIQEYVSYLESQIIKAKQANQTLKEVYKTRPLLDLVPDVITALEYKQEQKELKTYESL